MQDWLHARGLDAAKVWQNGGHATISRDCYAVMAGMATGAVSLATAKLGVHACAQAPYVCMLKYALVPLWLMQL